MKKILSLLITVVLSSMFCITSSAALTGDVNKDGRITAFDARLILRHSAAIEFLQDTSVADLNNDGRVTAADARKALRIASSLDSAVNDEKLNISDGDSTRILTANEVYQKAKGFTAEIVTYKESGAGLTVGTGIFVTENKIATNYHVINGAYFAKIKTSDGETHNIIRVLGYDIQRDIAILETDYKSPYTAFAGTLPETGDTVYALGSTKGYTGTFTQGNVSCNSRVLRELGNGVEYIQFTSPVAEGNSGGPVLDVYGNVVGMVSLTNSEGQNLNFALPVSELKKADISSPSTLKEIAEKNADSEFEGEIALSYPAVTLKKGGTALIYALVSATDEYNLSCESDNESVVCKTGRTYGNVNVVYVWAKESDVSGSVKIFIEGHKEVFAILDVTAGAEAPDIYSGINGDVADFGAFTGTAPSECDENTLDGKNAYSFAYSFDSLNENGVDRENAIEGYRELLENNGYEFISSSQNNTNVVFFNSESRTTVTLGITTDDSGKYYMFVLIVK